MAEGESVVCRVEKIKWPVMEDLKAISAVSMDRISPTIMTSGSWRNMASSPVEKVMFALGFTCI